MTQVKWNKVKEVKQHVFLWGFFALSQPTNGTVLFLHPDVLQHAETGTGQIFEVQIIRIYAS